MESHKDNLIKLQNCHKSPSYSPNHSELTPKKEIQMKIQHDYVEPTLQKNLILRIQNIFNEKTHNLKLHKKIKRPWNKEEDDLLRNLVETKGAKQWAHISSYFQDRCGKQCRERWHNHLRNGIRKGQWTTDEQWTLFLGVHAYGKKWSTISKMLQGRTENTLKNHWNCKMKPKKLFFQRKLESLLGYYNFDEFQEKKLFQIIKQKKVHQQIRVNEVINLLKTSLRQFQEVKKQILGHYQRIQTPKILTGRQKMKSYDLYSFGSFGKNKNFEGTTCQKSRENSSEVKRRIFNQEFQDEYVLSPFELDSNERIKKEVQMDLQQSIKESLTDKKIFQERSEIHEESSYSGSNSEYIQQKSDFCEKYEICDFSSPIKPNIFESIDLGQSNKKKKLFE